MTISKKQLIEFMDEGILPKWSPSKRAYDALSRCLWLLKDPNVKKILKGYDVDFVIKYGQECLDWKLMKLKNKKRNKHAPRRT